MSPKYHNKKTVIDNVTFDSLAEAHRYSELKLMEMAGEISYLELQPKFPIIVNGKKIATYIADFRYKTKDGLVIIEDVKSSATRKLPVYRLKKKLIAALYGVEVMEVV